MVLFWGQGPWRPWFFALNAVASSLTVPEVGTLSPQRQHREGRDQESERRALHDRQPASMYKKKGLHWRNCLRRETEEFLVGDRVE